MPQLPPNLPPELKRATEIFQERLELLHCQTRSVLPDEWTTLPSHLRSSVPDWLIELHASFRICDCVLHTTEPAGGLNLVFWFCDPKALISIFGYEELIILPENGFFPVGGGQDGNLWLLRTTNGSRGEIYWFELSSWDGTLEGIKDAITFASENLGCLMLAMEIGNESRHLANSAMWSRVERQDE